ncbi:hypothetical protein ABLE92_09870 [Gordonia sp. VNQ95]|uniref:hypothetical protein n=1 Tax=Gordonia TaxID=2053 RepID=UPI0032B45B27
MSSAQAVAVAVTFVWLGMVVAISFVEAPLKFRAPGITIPLGLGIGRLVFRALNAFEMVWAVVLVVAVVSAGLVADAAGILAVAAVVLLGVQVLAIRPALNRRSDAVLAGEVVVDGPRSHAHLVYVAAEVVKVGLLIATGVTLLSA